ncbi:MAG: thioredoxin domain-containing protein, partial [Bryobacteraceae bacterium]
AGLQRRDRRRRNWQRGCIWSTAMASVCAVAMIALPAPARCAMLGVSCPRPAVLPVLLRPAVAGDPAPQSPVAVAKASAPAPTPVLNYKQSGSPAAPVVCEIYSDYECPACASFYTTVFPQFVAEFVKTGKVRVVHRDFPLPQHAFSKLAARYADAAGETGHFEEVEKRLFMSQSEWTVSGNVDAAVAQVLPEEIMRKVRALVKSDPGLDATVADDLTMVARDHVNQTPTIVFVYKGTRRKVDGGPSLDLLRSYLEEMLAK